MRRTYPETGRVAQLLRGGSWNNNPRNCRSAYRNHNQPDNANNNVDQPATAADPHSAAGRPARPWLRHRRRIRALLFAPAMTTSAPRVSFLLRQPRQVQGYREVLVAAQGLSDGSKFGAGSTLGGGGLDDLALTMVWIPPGRFWMGSPAAEAERADSEGPQHLVQLQGFFMGQTPITQAQWREVAGWEPVERRLDQEPSAFVVSRQYGPARKGGAARTERFQLLAGQTSTDDCPVERVSWDDAMEFCRRLSQRTGRTYTLPSEAQWEYACRAGTSTPFHFGEMITTELANYNVHTYANGPKGEYREQTTVVGMFPANAWGLQDMHGNVFEWCLDHWHETYEGAPVDGSAWLDDEGPTAAEDSKKERLLRGGSWNYRPLGWRSGSRNLGGPFDGLGILGFRVVCLPQGPSLNP